MSRETDCKILKKLSKWKPQEGSLPDIVELYKDFLNIQCNAKAHISGRQLARQVILERLQRGDPLQPLQDLPIHWWLLQNLFQQFLGEIEKRSFIPTKDMKGLREIAFNGFLIRQIVESWYEEKPLPSSPLHVDNDLLCTIIQASIWPFLTVQSETLIAEVDQTKWRRSYCPICGGKADFCFLGRDNGARWLSCSRCDAEWLFQRLKCPYCGSQQQSKLAYFTDEERRYRLYLCEQCRAYIKAIDLREIEEEPLIPLEKIMTAHLDHQAQEAGFNPGWAKKVWLY